MDPETEGRFDGIDLRLTAAEEKTISQDAVLTAIKQLILRGMRLLAETQEAQKVTEIKLNALTNAQIVTEDNLKALTAAQIATEESLRRLLDRPPNGH